LSTPSADVTIERSLRARRTAVELQSARAGRPKVVYAITVSGQPRGARRCVLCRHPATDNAPACTALLRRNILTDRHLRRSRRPLPRACYAAGKRRNKRTDPTAGIRGANRRRDMPLK